MNKHNRSYYWLLSAVAIFGFVANAGAGTLSVYDSVPSVQTDTNSSSQPQPHFIFINKSDAASTGINFKSNASPNKGTVTGYHWVFDGGTPGTADVQNPGTVRFASLNELDSKLVTLGVTHQGSNGEPCADKNTPVTKINVVVPRIDPDSGQTGVIGDIVPSNITDGTQERHFVSPKATSSDYVVLTANVPGVTASNFGILLEWDSSVGTDVPGSPDKWRVSRATPGKYTIKLKRVTDHTEVARINVWIVWADKPTSPTVGSATFTVGTDRSSYPVDASNGWLFVFTIQPPSIITDADHPDLSGSNATGSGRDVPGNGNTYTINPSWGAADSATAKWDMSRQMSVWVRNPGGISKAALGTPTAIFVNQPTAFDNPVTFPGNAVEGNDDPPIADEDDNPYNASTRFELTHAIGQLSSFDAPNFAALKSWGVDGRTYAVELGFREFARLQIWDGTRNSGTYWFKISDNLEWHYELKTIYANPPGQWNNNGSNTGTGAISSP